MNKQFAEYATSTAFAIQLSKNQCNFLLRLENFERTQLGGLNDPALTVGGLRGLEARGLVHWKYDASGKPDGFQGLTEAGKVMVQLLKLAGMTVQNTNTLSVLRRVA